VLILNKYIKKAVRWLGALVFTLLFLLALGSTYFAFTKRNVDFIRHDPNFVAFSGPPTSLKLSASFGYLELEWQKKYNCSSFLSHKGPRTWSKYGNEITVIPKCKNCVPLTKNSANETLAAMADGSISGFDWMAECVLLFLNLWHIAIVAWLLCVPFVITHVLRRRRSRAALFPCEVCGYDLQGNQSGTCPECGSACVIAPAEESAASTRDESSQRIS